MLELLFDWKAAFGLGTDVVVFLIMALVGTTFFALRLLLALIFGGNSDFDTGDQFDGTSDSSFRFFSLLSILAFFMGAGWMGLTCRIDWHKGGLAFVASAAGFGFGMMSLASGLMLLTRRLNRTIDYDLATAIGKTGRVYMTVRPHGKGRGQVQVDVSGRRKVLDAVSSDGKIAEFSSVRIIEIRDDQMLVVSIVLIISFSSSCSYRSTSAARRTAYSRFTAKCPARAPRAVSMVAARSWFR